MKLSTNIDNFIIDKYQRNADGLEDKIHCICEGYFGYDNVNSIFFRAKR